MVRVTHDAAQLLLRQPRDKGGGSPCLLQLAAGCITYWWVVPPCCWVNTPCGTFVFMYKEKKVNHKKLGSF